MTDSSIYLDHAASTPLHNRAVEYLEKTFRESWANPSSAHKMGRQLSKEIEGARKLFLKIARAQKSFDFIFTGSATESNNMVVRSFEGSKTSIVNFAGDHPSVVEPAKLVTRSEGSSLIGISVNENGNITEDEILKVLNHDVDLLILSHVNNHNGLLLPVEAISKKIKNFKPDLHIHVDGVQAFGKIEIDLENSGIDSYCISAHKMGGPKGVAGLFLRKSHKLKPLLVGGGQEYGLRASTVNHPGIVAWQKVLEETYPNIASSFAHVGQLKKEIIKKLSLSNLPFAMFESHEVNVQFSPYILQFAVKGLSSDILLRHLEEVGIYISSSSACSSRAKGDSPVFSALGIPVDIHKNVLRVSLSSETTLAEADQFCDSIISIHGDLMGMLGGRR